MRHWFNWRRLAVLGAAVFACQWSLTAQTPAKRPLSYDVYDYWHSIGATRLSRDGQWLAYAVTSQAEDGELIIRNLKTGKEFKTPRGTNPQFTNDDKFAIFTIAAPKTNGDATAGETGAAAEPAAGGEQGGGRAGGAGAGRTSMGIMTLATGDVKTFDRVGSFRLPEESSTWLAYHRGNGGAGGAGRGGAGGGRGGGRGGGGGAPAPAAAGGGGQAGGAQTGSTAGSQNPAAQNAGGGQNAGGRGNAANANGPQEKRKDPGADLIVRNLTTGDEVTIAEVNEFDWNKDGSILAFSVSSAKPENDGAFIRRSSDGAILPLRKAHGNYRSLAFDDTGKQIAFLSDDVDYAKPVSPYRLFYWKQGDTLASEVAAAGTRGMPANMVVSEFGGARFSNDGARLYFGYAPPPAPPAAPNAKRPVQVDLWSYKDPLLQPMQQVRANQERQRNFRAEILLASKQLVVLGGPDLPNVNPGDDPVRAVGTSDAPYQQEISWDTTYNDVYLVDLKTGARRKVMEHFNGGVTMSPGGGYLLYFDEASGNWFTYRIADGTRTNLTERLPVKFAQEDHDTPDLAPSYGSAGWTDADKSVVLYDAYDMWEIHPDGTAARMITAGEGRKQHLQFRYRSLDPDAKTISSTKPLLLTTINDDTRAGGFYRTTLASTTAPEKVMMVDRQVGPLTKARDADTVVFTEQDFDVFPDLWVSDMNFANPQKVSNANPQQAEFTWGKSEKIQYINGNGKVLNAILIKPENFDPKKKYPMMVYIYEDLSDGVHAYHAPNVGTSISLTRYVSNGYVVLEPDISYETGYPGPSAMKCVIPAINTVVAQGYIDPKRIGIQGHSWGGYQIAYMITQTNIFAAVEAGAAVTNMFSAYGGIRWGTGMSREFQYEKTQSRIGKTMWEAPLQFIENSAIFWIDRIQTPYLTIHNDADDAVPWEQGIEFNTAMRRLGKVAYMFTYNGQPHGLRDREDMKHWTVHMDEFFDYYLLNKPRPSWMDTGVPFLQKGTRDVDPLFKKTVVAPAANGSKGGGGGR